MKKGSCRMYGKPGSGVQFLVRIMAVDDNYAMVRRPGKMPFVADVSWLSRLSNENTKLDQNLKA